ncbi:reverse transcriptase domain-containing protein [Tanacetum coccineum]
MEILSHLKDVEMMRIKMKNPPLDQTGRSKRRRAGKEPESTSAPKEKTSKTIGKSTEGSKSHHKSADKSVQAKAPMHTAKDLEEPAHQEFVTRDTEDKPDKETSQLPDCTLAQKEDTRESFNKLMDTPLDFSAFVMNRLKVDTLTLELLAGPTFELMKGSCKSLVELKYFFEEVYKVTTDQLDWNNPKGRQVIPFDHFINNDLAYLSGGVSSRTYTTSVTKTKATDYGHIKWIEDLVPNRMWSQVESARDVYSKCRIIAVTKLQIVQWRNYKHLDWITVRRDDDKLYKFKEGGFNRLRIQDIKDMLLFLIQGKLTNLTVKERLAFNVSLRMFTRSIVIQRRVEDLQLSVESYQKKLNLIKPDTDGTLNDVRTALNDRLRGIQMKYPPQTIWRHSNRDKAGAMIQAIDKQLKTRRIMRNLEKFVGGRPYEVIMESLVKKKQKGAILELKRRNLKNTIFCTYTPWCMTRSSTKELLLPLENPERVLRSRRKLFDNLSLVELNLREDDQLSEIKEHIEEEVTEIMAETMEQYMSKTQEDYGSGVSRPTINQDTPFELKGQFLKELRDNTFSGSEQEDANEHIEKVLEIVDLFYILKVTQDQIMLRAFPVSLTGAASRWLRNQPSGSITTWDVLKTKFLNKYCPPARTAKKMEEINNFQQELDERLFRTWERFKELLMKCPQHYLTDMQEVILFYNGLDVPTRQILDSKGVIPSKTVAVAKTAI